MKEDDRKNTNYRVGTLLRISHITKYMDPETTDEVEKETTAIIVSEVYLPKTRMSEGVRENVVKVLLQDEHETGVATIPVRIIEGQEVIGNHHRRGYSTWRKVEVLRY